MQHAVAPHAAAAAAVAGHSRSSSSSSSNEYDAARTAVYTRQGSSAGDLERKQQRVQRLTSPKCFPPGKRSQSLPFLGPAARAKFPALGCSGREV